MYKSLDYQSVMPNPPAEMINVSDVRRQSHSSAIPIYTKRPRDYEAIDLRLREDEADYCDYCVYQRIVNGMIRRHKFQESSSIPPKNAAFLETINSIVRTRHASLTENGFEDPPSLCEEDYQALPGSRCPSFHLDHDNSDDFCRRCPNCASAFGEHHDARAMHYPVGDEHSHTTSMPDNEDQIFAIDL